VIGSASWRRARSSRSSCSRRRLAQIVLEDEIVSADPHRHPDLRHLLISGDDDRNHRRARPDLLDQHQPVTVARVGRQAQIDQRDVQRLRVQRGPRRRQAVGLDDGDVVQLANDRGQHAPRARLIVDDKQPHESRLIVTAAV
jgi:hypothetical protein